MVPAEAALRFNVSERWVYALLARYRVGGIEAVDPKSKRPHTNPNATGEETIEAILKLRASLLSQSLDAGQCHVRVHGDLAQQETSTQPTRLAQPDRVRTQPHHHSGMRIQEIPTTRNLGHTKASTRPGAIQNSKREFRIERFRTKFSFHPPCLGVHLFPLIWGRRSGCEIRIQRNRFPVRVLPCG